MPSALAVVPSFGWTGPVQVEILADGVPSALVVRPAPRCAGQRVEILADGVPSALDPCPLFLFNAS